MEVGRTAVAVGARNGSGQAPVGTHGTAKVVSAANPNGALDIRQDEVSLTLVQRDADTGKA